MNDTTNPGPAKAASRFKAPRQKVPPFARYVGTSAWRKYRRRVREYARFQAAERQADQTSQTPPS